MREMFTIFLYGQYINRIVIKCGFQKCTLISHQSWHLQEICQNVTVISGKIKLCSNFAVSRLCTVWHWHWGVGVSYPQLSDWTHLQWALCMCS